MIHILFVILAVCLFLSLIFFKRDADEFAKLPKALQLYFKLYHALWVILIWLYAFCFALTFSYSMEEFGYALGLLLIGSSYINALIITYRVRPYSLVKTVVITTIVYLVAMIVLQICFRAPYSLWSVALKLTFSSIFPFNVFAFVIAHLAVTKTKEQVILDAEIQERRIQLKAEEEARKIALEEERKEAIRERNRQAELEYKKAVEEGRITPNRSLNQVNPKIPKYNFDNQSKSNSSTGFWDSINASLEDKKDLKNVESTSSRKCSNCMYFEDGCCTNSSSNSNGSRIFNPQYHNCGYHQY